MVLPKDICDVVESQGASVILNTWKFCEAFARDCIASVMVRETYRVRVLLSEYALFGHLHF